MFNLFDEDFLNEAMMMDGHPIKHGIKLMYIRKAAEKKKYPFSSKLEEDEEVDYDSIKYKDNLPYEIYGPGEGLDNTRKLRFWEKINNVYEDGSDWEEEEDSGNAQGGAKSKDDEESDDEGEEIEEEDILEQFIEENTKEMKTGKLCCKLCDKKLSYEAMKKHFIKTHQKEYEESPYIKECTWKEAIEINKKMEEQFEDEFMKGMGMDDMNDLGMDMNFDKMFSGKGNKGMKDFEKMMMGMMFGGNSGPASGNKKKKR